MSLPVWISLVVGYPLLLALILCWFQGVYRDDDLEPPQLAPAAAGTMRVDCLGREVARFEVLEHVAPGGEVLQFHVPPAETRYDWTVDEVAETLAAIERLSEAPERETL